jgi:hypothetical protein
MSFWIQGLRDMTWASGLLGDANDMQREGWSADPAARVRSIHAFSYLWR